MLSTLNRIAPNGFIYPLFFVFTCIFLMLSQPLEQFPDTYWHIAAGDYIRTNGIPAFDPWALNNQTTQWVNISWLFDYVLSYITQTFSIESISIFRALGFSLISCILFRNVYARGVGLETALIITAVCSMPLFLFLSPRPHLITFAIAMLFHHILHRSRERHTAAYVLPAFMLLWVNCHGGFLVGFLLFGAYGLEALQAKNFKWLKHLVISGAICLLAAMCNPLGFGILDATLRSMNSVLAAHIQEWEPTAPFGYMAASIFFLVFVLTTNLQDKEIKLADKVVAMGFFLLGMDAVRNFPLFALLAAPYTATCISRLKPIIEQKIELIARSLKGKTLSCAISTLCLVLFISNANPTPNNEKALLAGLKDATQYALKHYPEKLFLNHYDTGGPIIYYGKTKLKHFVDGRADTAFTRDRLKDALTLAKSTADPFELIDKWNMNAAILKNKNIVAIAMNNNDQWIVGYDNGDYTIFIKKD